MPTYTGCKAQSLVQSSKMPTNIDRLGEQGWHLYIQLASRNTNTWRAMACAHSLLSDNSTSAEPCFSLVLMSVKAGCFVYSVKKESGTSKPSSLCFVGWLFG